MATRELWCVTLMLEHEAAGPREPHDLPWAGFRPTRLHDVSAHFLRTLSDDECADHSCPPTGCCVHELLERPLAPNEIRRRAAADPQGLAHAVVAIDLRDLIDHDADWFLKQLAERAFGRTAEVCFDIVDVDGSDLLFDVHVDPGLLLDHDVPKSEEGA